MRLSEASLMLGSISEDLREEVVDGYFAGDIC